MTLKTFPDLVQGTDEWHAARRGIVTASAVSKLISVRPVTALNHQCPECGAAPDWPCLSKVKRNGEAAAPIKSFHPARAALPPDPTIPPVLEVAANDDSRGLTAVLTAERITGYTDPTYMSDDMWRGMEDEPLAVDKYSEFYAPVTTAGFMVRDEWGYKIGYSPDGLVGEDGLIEVKSRRQKKQLITILSGQVPAENMAQLQTGLLVSGRKWIDYVSYTGGMPMWKHRVLPDPRWFNIIIAAVQEFEFKAAEMIAAYNIAVEGLPTTERSAQTEMVI